MEAENKLMEFPYDICDEEGTVIKSGAIKAYSFERALLILKSLREETGNTRGGYALGCIPESCRKSVECSDIVKGIDE